ncbi:MAG: benzoyl-CoA 2,3-epoxidase subunit BoxA [Rhodobacteraceae bacterium]|nr:benzoyl-CoA 2,3-epoxidase subunit BoxA [Paracoccaceae bacterium]
MTTATKQHLIDPELCIRCYTCEEICPIDAITHNDDNVAVDASICDNCMDCILPCPTGSIDEWRVVETPYSLDEQFEWMELPEQEDFTNVSNGSEGTIEAIDESITALLNEAHQGAGGKSNAPASASKPAINLYSPNHPVEATVQGNFRLTEQGADADIRHIILNLGANKFPLLEGQTVGITPPGIAKNGKPHMPRLYSVSSPRDGERPNTNNLSLTVKREEQGICSNYICDLEKGAKVQLCGPFGSTFLMPDDPQAKLIMICTGTGSAPFRGFTMRHQRVMPEINGVMHLFFGARTADSLPYFGPLKKVPQHFLTKHFALSREPDTPKQYVQDRLWAAQDSIAPMLAEPTTYIYLCGLKAMEDGVEEALTKIAAATGQNWLEIRDTMRETGRYHVETY